MSLVESVTRFSPRQRPGGAGWRRCQQRLFSDRGCEQEAAGRRGGGGAGEEQALSRPPDRGHSLRGSSHRRFPRPLRLVQYGPDGGPSRGLASGRAVSCFDYSWELTRVDEAERVLGGADLLRAGAA